jgi:hypothetical protein
MLQKHTVANSDQLNKPMVYCCSALQISFSFYLKVKVKVTLEQATKADRWSRGIALLFL